MLLFLSIVAFAFIVNAKGNGNGEIPDTEGVEATTCYINFQRSGGADFMFDCIVNGSTQTIVYDRYHDNGLKVYYQVEGDVHVVLKNFRYLNGNAVPNSKLSIQGMYGGKNPKSIPGGIEFDMGPTVAQNGFNLDVSN